MICNHNTLSPPRLRQVFLFPTLYGHVVVGPTSDEVTERKDAVQDPADIAALCRYAREVQNRRNARLSVGLALRSSLLPCFAVGFLLSAAHCR